MAKPENVQLEMKRRAARLRLFNTKWSPTSKVTSTRVWKTVCTQCKKPRWVELELEADRARVFSLSRTVAVCHPRRVFTFNYTDDIVQRVTTCLEPLGIKMEEPSKEESPKE